MTNQTTGSILRQKREEKKLSLEQVFQAIRIRLNYLQAIENDQLDQLPSRAQARGFIRLYANFLGLDPFVLLEPPAPPIAPEESIEPIEKKPAAVKEESEPTVKRKLEDLLQQKSGKFEENITRGSSWVKDSYQHLLEKIPFKIVRKDQELIPQNSFKQAPSTESKKETSVAENPTYRMMSRAIGEDLRSARETIGLSLADVERQIRIREFYLYAIEEGNLDDLPSTAQGRGMLGNYASFLNLEPEVFLSRFAEVLQQRRLETIPEKEAGVPLPVTAKRPITGWKRLLSPDLVFTGGIFLVFFVFIIWGAFQLMGVGGNASNPTVIPISDFLLASGTPETSENVTIETSVPTVNTGSNFVFTPGVIQTGTISISQNATINLTIAANRRAYLKIIVDGKSAFLGRTQPGNVYTFSGNSKISLTCGDASAIQIYYNDTNLGVLGISGQVVNMDFTAKEAIDLAAGYTATATVTQAATLTPNPTATPTLTPVPPTDTPNP